MNTSKLATSYANANAGTAIDLTSSGSGVLTIGQATADPADIENLTLELSGCAINANNDYALIARVVNDNRDDAGTIALDIDDSAGNRPFHGRTSPRF